MNSMKWRMKDHTPAEQLAFLRRIKNTGCPVEIDEELQSDRGGLIIRQVGAVSLSRVFDINPCGTGYMLNVLITCDMSEFHIDDYELFLPWEDPQFHWLEAIEGAPEHQAYSFRGKCPLEFPRDEVINHFRSPLRRRQQIEGLLLGFGHVPIPDRYQRGGINVKFSVLDHLGNRFSSMLTLCVDRSERELARSSRKPARSGLFERGEAAQAMADTPLRKRDVTAGTRSKATWKQEGSVPSNYRR